MSDAIRRLSLLAAALLTGCAVMKIDVDVYKGPLANHDEVQAQQLAVMAIAARPLLVRLRDVSEWPPDGGIPAGAAQDERARYTAYKRRYVADYMETREGDAFNFTNEYAKRVNAILSLYKDKGPPELALFLQQVDEILRSYRDDVGVLVRVDDDGLNADALSWREMQKDLKKQDPGPASLKALAEDMDSGQCGTFDKDELAYLTQAFRVLLDTNFFRALLSSSPGKQHFNSYALRNATECLRQRTGTRVSLSGTPFEKAELVPSDRSSNAMFDFLSEPANVRRYADLLFKPGSERPHEFERRVGKIARSYHSARRSLHELLQRTLAMQAQMRLPALRDFDKEHPEVRRALAQMIVRLQQPQYLILSTCFSERWDPRFEPALRSLRARLRPIAVSDWNNKSAYPNANRAVEELLLEDPVAMQTLMPAAGAVLSEIRVGAQPNCQDGIVDPRGAEANKPDGWSFGAEFRYGITRGPTLSQSDAETFISAIDKALKQLVQAGALGLEQGRLGPGLDTLVNSYVTRFPICRDERQRAADSPMAKLRTDKEKCDDWSTLREELGNSLIHFAEKVLYTANNDVLLDTTRAEVAVSSDYLSGSSGQEYEERLRKQRDNAERRRQYTLVLQAVGTSILTLVDDRRFRRLHEGRLVINKEAELETLQRALGAPPQGMIDALIADFHASATAQAAVAAAGSKRDAEADVTGKDKAAADAQAALVKAKQEKTDADTALQSTKTTAAPLLATLNTLAGGDDAETKADADRLRKSVVGDQNDSIKAADMVEAIRAWLDDQVKAVDKAYRSQTRPDRLTKASAYLRERKDEIGPGKELPRAEMLDAIIANLRLNKVAADAAIAAAQKSQTEKETAAQTADGKAKDAAERAASAKKESEAGKKVVTDASGAQAEYDAAAWVLQNCKALLVRAAVGSDAASKDMAPDAMFNNIKQALAAGTAKKPENITKCAQKAGENVETLLANARKALDRRIAPIGWARISVRDLDDGSNARDVLDRLISALQYARIQAAQQDPSGVWPKQLAAAIEVAEEYRSDMVYLRLASVYLRNSYPASALQADPGLAWSNMLGEAALRGVPFIGGQITNGSGREDLRIQSQIDKQFWQNVNSVRVSGPGTTNYVIAKDDIGNWYLKAYATDQKDIIKSAQSLALFNLGNKAGNYLGQLEKRRAALAQDGSGDAGEPAPLERLLQLNEAKYVKKTKEDYDSARKDLAPDVLSAAVTKAWKDDAKLKENAKLGDLNSELGKATEDLRKDWPAFGDGKKPEEQASQIADGLSALLRFRNALARRVADQLAGDAEARRAALDDVDRAVGPLIGKALSSRQAAVKEYTTAISFIGEVVTAEKNPPPVKLPARSEPIAN